MDKHSFYKNKIVVKIEWWLSECHEYPNLYWARLRVFSDGSADSAFEESKVYGFDDRKFASYFLSEDEYIPFDRMDKQDEADIGAKKSDLLSPFWGDSVEVEFEYLGTY
jgi:hypothetical protein